MRACDTHAAHAFVSIKPSLDLVIQAHENDYHFVCSFCGLGFNYLQAFNGHVNLHREEKPYACTKCPKAFTHQSDLTRHRKACGITDRSFQCGACHKNFKNKQGRTNSRNHDDKPKHQCAICGKVYVHQSSLKKHVKTHSSTVAGKCHHFFFPNLRFFS